MAFARDGAVAICADELRGIKIFDLAGGKELAGIASLGGFVTLRVPSSRPDVVYFSKWDGTMRIWDLQAARELWTMPQPVEGVFTSVFASDGNSALSWGTDRVMRFWNFARVSGYDTLGARMKSAVATLQNNATNPQALAALGEWFAFHGEWSRAATLLENATAGGAEISHLSLARSYWKTGKTIAAAVEYDQAARRGEAPAAYIDLCKSALARVSPAPAPATQR